MSLFNSNSKGAEPEFRNPRVKLLWDTWRNVWIMAWERQRRLQDKLNYIQELDRVANFSWDDWRKRVILGFLLRYITRKLDVDVSRNFKLITSFFPVLKIYES